MPYYVYITTTKNNTSLYVGVTSDSRKRITEHKQKLMDGFTKKYNINKLVYYEPLDDVKNAIQREKKIKGGSRQKKIILIRKMNPKWEDLTAKL